MVNIINPLEVQSQTEQTDFQSKRLNLRICGSESTAVSYDDVQSVETPAPTETWRPIAHDYLVGRMKNHLDSAGFNVVGEAHNLARSGQRYFGLFQVNHNDRNNNERGTIVGLRNAHDKCFPAGLCAGDAPFVCDNLIFHNEVTLARRHTKNILKDLDMVIARTLGKLFGMWNKQDQRVEAYENRELENAEVNDIVVRAYQAGAIGKTKIADVVEQWQDSDHDEFSYRNMNSLYNGFTEVYKGNLMALPKRSEALHSVLDAEVGFAPAELEVA